MALGRERVFFAAGNTPQGFVNFFHDIASGDEREIYIIKGGPGTGKSKLMKNISRAAISEGYDVEVIKCSSDPDSYDGLRIPELKKTILDGTAPHTMDMDVPGARDHIVNLGDFWNSDMLQKHKSDIINLSFQKSESYTRMYNYLKAAGCIYANTERATSNALSLGSLNIFTKNICDNFFADLDISCRPGRVRNMFGSAITPKGIQTTLNTLFRNMKVYVLKCDYGNAASHIIDQLQGEAVKRGFYVESLKCPFSPSRTEHLIIPKLSLAFTTHNKYHAETDCDVFGEYLLNVYYNDLITEPYLKDMEYDLFRVQELIDKAGRHLEKSRLYHRQIEDFYTSCMDFDGINQLTSELTDNILQR